MHESMHNAIADVEKDCTLFPVIEKEKKWMVYNKSNFNLKMSKVFGTFFFFYFKEKSFDPNMPNIFFAR